MLDPKSAKNMKKLTSKDHSDNQRSTNGLSKRQTAQRHYRTLIKLQNMY